MILLFARNSEFDFQKNSLLLIGLIGILFIIYITFSFVKNFNNKEERINRLFLLLVAAFFTFIGIKGYFDEKNFQENQLITKGKTLRIDCPVDGGCDIVYEYYVNGKKYQGKSTYYPADLNQIVIPNGEYPVIYNAKKPEVSDMDFTDIPKKVFQ